jgi:hypothetical protein
MGKKKTGKTLKLGAPEHFTGYKLAFLATRAESYQQALDSKAVTAFYNKVTLEFVAKYGQEEPFSKEFVDDPPDPEDIFDEGGDDDDPSRVHPSKEEAAENAILFTKLRTVCHKCITYLTLF